MPAETDLNVLSKAVVDATIQLHDGSQAAPDVNARHLIRMRRVLRNLCLAYGSWTRSLESAYQADIAALCRLGGIEPFSVVKLLQDPHAFSDSLDRCNFSAFAEGRED